MPTTTPIPTNAAAEKRSQELAPALNLVPAQLTEKQSLTEVKYALSHALQSSLDLNETLMQFFELLQKVISVDGMSYLHTDGTDSIKQGEQRAHQANYGLSASDQPLGKISFYRAKRFTETELQSIETFIGILILPLRNALLYREAMQSSLRDALTGVGNRRAMNESLKHELSVAERYRQPFSCLMLDIDHFKKINDTQGHLAGDEALILAADCLKHAVRRADQVFRFGGEEFILILGKTQHKEALKIAERVRQTIETTGRMTASVSITSYSTGDDSDRLLSRLDAALYEAKANGRNCVVSTDTLTQKRACAK